MEETTLKIGEHTVTFKKSDDLIAVKGNLKKHQEAVSAAKSAVNNVEEPEVLGEFVIFKAKNIPKEEVSDKVKVLKAHNSVDVATHVFHTSDDLEPFIPSQEFYIEFDENASTDDGDGIFEEYELEFVEPRGEREYIARLASNSSRDPIEVASALQKSPLIAIAEPELITRGKLHAFTVPTVNRFTEQWHLENQGAGKHTKVSTGIKISRGLKSGADARVVEAWKRIANLGSPNVVVAVIDDGFDMTHPAFNGKTVHPKDFTRNNTNPIPGTEDYHGTACAGVAVGSQNSEILGAAPNSKLMPVRWGPWISDKEIENWFDYVQQQGAWVVSCSWGVDSKNFPLSTRMKKAIEKCATQGREGKGCVICFAAGNSNHDINNPGGGTLDGFAIHPNVIAVAASTSKDGKANYSNYGQAISVCAPSNGAGGWQITTSDVRSSGYNSKQGTHHPGYTSAFDASGFGGTSSACPLVAGVCALMLSVNPALTSQQVKQIIQETARKIGPDSSYNDSGHSIYYGYGCINALEAVKKATEILPQAKNREADT